MYMHIHILLKLFKSNTAKEITCYFLKRTKRKEETNFKPGLYSPVSFKKKIL